MTSDGVEPHADYLREFPFLGQPNAQGQSEDIAGGEGLAAERAPA